MIGNRICAFAFAAAFAILCLAAPANASPYDGSWKMSLVTTDGHCGIINAGLSITGGKIISTSGRFVFRPIHIVGRISSSGQTSLNGVAGPRQAKGLGRFTQSKGSGKWNGTGPSGVCSGYWVATRG